MNVGLYGYPNREGETYPAEPPFSDIPTWRSPASQNGGTNTSASGTLYLTPIKIYRPVICDGLAVKLTATPAASLDIFITVYTSHDYRPTHLLGFGSIPGVLTSGVKATLIPDLYLAPGMYWAGGFHVSSTSASQAFETRASGGDQAPRGQWWAVSHHGQGSSPGLAAGNDGVAWQQTGRTVPPPRFGGTVRTDANNPSGTLWVDFRMRKG